MTASRLIRRSIGRGLLVLGLSLACTAPASADPTWRLEQPPPPAGAPFKVALGAPGDLEFWAPNRGLLSVEGNDVVAGGLFYWNGRTWRQLATVCGGSSDTSRIAWAGPNEFWTISAPSRPRIGNGITLCRFKDGAVVASYGTLPQASDPYQLMNAAVCRTADDCWFGGPSAQDPSGSRRGAFRLHWDGTALSTSYGPQGRGISDLDASSGTIVQSSFAGPGPEIRRAPALAEAEPTPRLISSLTPAGTFATNPFSAAAVTGEGVEASELLALDGNGSRLWAVGGGAASGPDAPAESVVPRSPLVATSQGANPFSELTLVAPSGTLATTDRFVDVAAIPGTDEAWVAVQRFSDRASINARAVVARVNAATGSVSTVRLPSAGGGRGSAVRIACPAADQCWMATYGGWLFRWSDGAPLAEDVAPAFQNLLTFRPNESAAQFVPDRPPVDDSLLLAPPPVEVQPEVVPTTKTKRLPALIKNLKKPKLRKTTLVLEFRLTRKARIQLVGRRGGRVVAKTKARSYRPGRVVLRLKLKRKAWPTKLSFVIREPGASSGDTDSNTAVTGGGS